MAVEQGGFSREATELALDHVADTAVVRAYDRGERLAERERLALWWNNQLCPPAIAVPPLRLHKAG
jgi:hypothetical protein